MTVTRWWTKVIDKVWDHLVLDEPSPRKPSKGAVEADSVETAIERARAEWIAARTYFDNVTDPELVDHAIFAIEAAERKYMYLLRHAEEFGYKIPSQPSLDHSSDSSPEPLAGQSSVSDRSELTQAAVEATAVENKGLTARFL